MRGPIGLTCSTGSTLEESGHVYFFYKPKVETDDPENIDDVSKCHMLLLPNPDKDEQDPGKPKYRFLTFGRKHLPASRDDDNHEVEWGMITGVGQDLSDLQDSLGSSTYETKADSSQSTGKVHADGSL